MNRIARLTGLAAVCGLALGCLTACAGTQQRRHQQKAPTTLQAVLSEEADDLNPFTPNEQGKSQICR